MHKTNYIMVLIGSIGKITFDLNFLHSFVSIVIIDLILAGDNAVVIAMERIKAGLRRKAQRHSVV